MKNDKRLQGVTSIPGFKACGIASGMRRSGRKDLALVLNTGKNPGAAGVVTPIVSRPLPYFTRGQCSVKGLPGCAR